MTRGLSAGGKTIELKVGNPDMEEFFKRSYHPRLKIFGMGDEVWDACYEENKRKGLIIEGGKYDEPPKGCKNLIQCGDGSFTACLPGSEELFDEIQTFENKWYARELIKQGYKRVR